MFSQEKKEQIIRVLNERFQKNGKPLHCPMCAHPHFTIADAYLRNGLQEDLGAVHLGGPAIPTVAVICTNCGFVSQHAIGVLGLMPKEEATK